MCEGYSDRTPRQMDRTRKAQHNRNIIDFHAATTMSSVPTYSLYGTTAEERLAEPLHCESIAERSRLHAWEIKPHRHEHFFQILYIRKGRAEAQLDRERLALARSSALVIPPHCVHGFVFSRDIDGIVVTLEDSYFRTLLTGRPTLSALFEAPRSWALTARDQVTLSVHQVFAMFMTELAAIAPWRGAAITSTLSLLLIGLGRLATDLPYAGSSTGGRVARHFQRFQERVETTYTQRRDIAAYAAELAITPTQLNRVCRQLAGKSALAIINDRVLLEAQRNLIYTELDIKQIALTIGFADASYFTRFFIKQCGQTPTDFRASARAQIKAKRSSA